MEQEKRRGLVRALTVGHEEGVFGANPHFGQHPFYSDSLLRLQLPVLVARKSLSG